MMIRLQRIINHFARCKVVLYFGKQMGNAKRGEVYK